MASNGTVEEQAAAAAETIRACTFGEVDAEKLPAFDVEYLFLQIRARSVGENIDVSLTCGCGEKTTASLDITKVGVQKSENHSNKIDLGDDLMLVMRYPRMTEIDKYAQNIDADSTIELIAQSIETIWQADVMYAATDYSKQELIEFVESLSPAAFERIETFFATMPVLKHDLTWDCKKCGAHNTATMQGIENFFA